MARLAGAMWQRSSRGPTRGPSGGNGGRGGYGGIASPSVVDYSAPVSAVESVSAGETDIASLLNAAGDGDQGSWDEVVGRHAGLVWSVARGFGLGEADAADVSQTVWLRLVENVRTLRDPAQLAAWLVTVTRRESVRVLRLQGREVADDDPAGAVADPAPSPERHVLQLESRQQLWSALTRLPPRCQALLRALVAVTESHYSQVAAALGMPVGSVGPTRLRCLDLLRRELGAAAAK